MKARRDPLLGDSHKKLARRWRFQMEIVNLNSSPHASHFFVAMKHWHGWCILGSGDLGERNGYDIQYWLWYTKKWSKEESNTVWFQLKEYTDYKVKKKKYYRIYPPSGVIMGCIRYFPLHFCLCPLRRTATTYTTSSISMTDIPVVATKKWVVCAASLHFLVASQRNDSRRPQSTEKEPVCGQPNTSSKFLPLPPLS